MPHFVLEHTSKYKISTHGGRVTLELTAWSYKYSRLAANAENEKEKPLCRACGLDENNCWQAQPKKRVRLPSGSMMKTWS